METKGTNESLRLEDFEIDFFDEELEKEEAISKKKGIKDFISDSVSLTSNSLLRATICELERALKDTRRLLFERDKENSVLRQDLEKARKELHKETQARKKLEVEKQSSNAEKARKEDNEKSKLREEIEALKERLSEFENPTESGDPDEIIPCCSSMHELVELQRKLKETEKQLEEFRVNNQGACGKVIAARQNVDGASKTSKSTQKEIQTQLKMKFLRDAFFYYMIDFHADEQMKAILAILDYEDRRADIIIESHKMKRQGKKFTVTEVSSRSLTFVHEEKL